MVLLTQMVQAAQPVPLDPSQQQRWQRERDAQQRLNQEVAPSVFNQAPLASSVDRLPLAEKPCFFIYRVYVEGPPPIRWAAFLPSLAGDKGQDPPEGRCLGNRGLDLLTQRMQQALLAKGYATTNVQIKSDQNLASGLLKLEVIPGRVGRIHLMTSPASPARVSLWNTVPISTGDILSVGDMEQALENFQRVPGVHIQIPMQPGSMPMTSDLLMNYQGPVKPWRLGLSIDDSGIPATGLFQGSLTGSWDNPLGLSDLFYLTLNHDLGGGQPGARGTRGYTTSYSLPLGYWSLSTTVSESTYYQNVVGLTQNYIYSGQNSHAEVALSRLLYRGVQSKVSASVKAFARRSKNFIDDAEILGQKRAIGGWQMDINPKWTWSGSGGTRSWDTRWTYKQGTGAFGSLPSPEEKQGQGTSYFGWWGIDSTLTLPFIANQRNFRYTNQLRLQMNDTPLTPQDRFSIGGRYSVRGFNGQNTLMGDRGWLTRNELSTSVGSHGHEVYFGLDYGEVGGPNAANLVGRYLGGAVLGWRAQWGPVQWEVFVGGPISKPDGFQAATTTGGFNMNMQF